MAGRESLLCGQLAWCIVFAARTRGMGLDGEQWANGLHINTGKLPYSGSDEHHCAGVAGYQMGEAVRLREVRV